MARPTKLTKELRDELCELLRQGSFVEPAVRACGIALSTHYDWLAKAERIGTETETNVSGLRGAKLTRALQKAGVSQAGTAAERRARLRELQLYRARVEQALAESEADAIKRISAAAVEDWRAAAWYLERAHPERWGKRPMPRRPPPPPDPDEPEYDDPEGPVGDQEGL